MNRRRFLSALSLAPATALLPSTLALLDLSRLSEGDRSEISASMWTYLWDIVDEGYESVLGRLRENGLTSISLATAYHAGKFLAPHNPKRKVVFLEDGTVYFKPDLKRYGRIKPVTNSLVAKGHGLSQVKLHAEKLGLQTRAWVVCCHNTPLGSKYPDIACMNAFGDRVYHNLCPSHADVRSYLRSLIRDIASNGVDAVELEALQFQGYTHGFHHEREGIELNSPIRFLLGLCFCPSCRMRAKESKFVITPIQTFTRQVLERFFDDPDGTAEQYPSLDSLPTDLIDPFLDWRRSVVVSLLQELAESAKSVRLRPLMHVDPAARKLVSTDPARAAAVTGGILALGYVKDGEALRSHLVALRKLVGQAEVTLGLQVGLPESGGRKEFLEKMSVAREIGIRSFNFYNYGFVPYDRLTWIKESLAS